MDASMELPASEVTMYKGTENNLETPPYIYYFRYVPYLFLAVLSYSMGYVLLAFQKEDILKRMPRLSSLAASSEYGRTARNVYARSCTLADLSRRCLCPFW